MLSRSPCLSDPAMNSPFAPLRPFFALAWLALAGCGQPALDPAVVAEHRTKLTLAEEPDDAQTVLDVRNTMMGTTEEVHDHDHADHDHGDEEHADHDHGDVDAAKSDANGPDEKAAKEDDHDHAEDDHADHDHADHDHDDGDHDHAHADHDHDKKPVIEEMDVVMVGTVGGVPNPSTQSHPEFPFAKRQAVFFLADPEAAAEYEEHAHQHAPGEECAFCSANAAEAGHMVAVVQFSNKDGKPLAADVRDLFDLKEKDTVVVKGKAKLAPGGMLTVDATGLYVRR
jgi:hypothetical protein